ncbi:hypothetical protein Mapa_013604 [Marchantia paleacea]|nr:hypothetical protein Mapa_013604 [Marchantia paleacea]
MAISTAGWSAPLLKRTIALDGMQVTRNSSSRLLLSWTPGVQHTHVLFSRRQTSDDVCLVSKHQLTAAVTPNKTSEKYLGFERNASAFRVSNSSNLRAHETDVSTYEIKGLETLDSGLSSNSSVTMQKDVQSWIEEIREMFRSMREGTINPSPYDTAWVSLIPALDGSQGPQFPKSLQWIVANQLEDGSWGDPDFFSISNNLLNTLICIIALKTWSTGLDSIEKGANFLRKNMALLADEADEMLCGFELVFPSLIDDAKKLDLDIPYNLDFIDQLRASKVKKLQKIPLNLVHRSRTTILYSLEGVRDVVDWDQISKLQQGDGSFLNSPASTACAYLHTGNQRCLQYLTSLVEQFHQAAPSQYPIEIFERLWVVDRLQRLGIARHFEPEIKACLDYVYKYFSSDVGTSWTSGCPVSDLDDSAMAFRMLRLHGYDVNANCFEQFRDTAEGGWYTFPGEMNPAVTATFNFYRAAQTCYPEESALIEGAEWARNFLLDKYTEKDFRDKWVIAKDLASEVGFALSNPWYQILPRLEHRSYLDQYGPDDVWISKVLYRMPNVHNSTFLKLAKADFNLCQTKHQEELQVLLRWKEELGFKSTRSGQNETVFCFYIAVGFLPAPELSMARKVYAQLAMLGIIIDDFFDSLGESYTDKIQFLAACRSSDPKLMDGAGGGAKLLFESIYSTLTDMAMDGSFVQGRDISHHIYDIWLRLAENQFKEAEWKHLNYQPSLEEYMKVAEVGISFEAMTLVQFFIGEIISDEMIESPHTKNLMHLANVITRLSNDIQTYQREESENKPNFVSISRRDGLTESDAIEGSRKLMHDQMRKLVKEVYSPSKRNGVLPKSVRQLYFDTVRAFLYAYRADDALASNRLETEQSVNRILFESVLP